MIFDMSFMTPIVIIINDSRVLQKDPRQQHREREIRTKNTNKLGGGGCPLSVLLLQNIYMSEPPSSLQLPAAAIGERTAAVSTVKMTLRRLKPVGLLQERLLMVSESMGEMAACATLRLNLLISAYARLYAPSATTMNHNVPWITSQSLHTLCRRALLYNVSLLPPPSSCCDLSRVLDQ